MCGERHEQGTVVTRLSSGPASQQPARAVPSFPSPPYFSSCCEGVCPFSFPPRRRAPRVSMHARQGSRRRWAGRAPEGRGTKKKCVTTACVEVYIHLRRTSCCCCAAGVKLFTHFRSFTFTETRSSFGDGKGEGRKTEPSTGFRGRRGEKRQAVLRVVFMEKKKKKQCLLPNFDLQLWCGRE